MNVSLKVTSLTFSSSFSALYSHVTSDNHEYELRSYLVIHISNCRSNIVVNVIDDYKSDYARDYCGFSVEKNHDHAHAIMILHY